LHAIKFDGYRMLVRIDGGKARFISRTGLIGRLSFPVSGSNAVSPTSEQFDDAATWLDLSTVGTTITSNHATYWLVREQLISLQDWVR